MNDSRGPLANKVAVVTGGASGIGRALGEELAHRGCEVVLADRQHELAAEVARGIAERGGRATAAELDVRSLPAFKALAADTLKRAGRIDYLFNNAGIGVAAEMDAYDPEDWDDVIQVNLTATFRLARAATKLMMRKRFGRIVAITSIVGVTGNPGQANYTASKAGIIGLIKTVGAEYAKRGVTANCIAPGFIKTAMTDALNDKQREAILTKVPAAKLGTPEDIAAAAVYLSSNEAGYVTGQTLHVNGGMAMF